MQHCISYTHLCMCLQLHSIVLSHNLPDSNAMLLPGSVPGYKDSDVKLLPSSTTKHAIWQLYIQAAATSLMRAVAYSTFTQLWWQLLPSVVVMKPMSDLCWVCQQNSTTIMRSANCSQCILIVVWQSMLKVGIKYTIITPTCIHVHVMQTIRQAELHLDVTRDLCTKKRWRRPSHQLCPTSLGMAPFPHHHQHRSDQPTRHPIFAHYSFDMAQQVFYPNDPLQLGPMYFLTPWKCVILEYAVRTNH